MNSAAKRRGHVHCSHLSNSKYLRKDGSPNVAPVIDEQIGKPEEYGGDISASLVETHLYIYFYGPVICFPRETGIPENSHLGQKICWNYLNDTGIFPP